MTTPTPKRAYSPRYDHALAYAAGLHATQTRKANDIPYISHLIAVSALVWEAGGDETAAIGALLHDAAEDQGGEETLEAIRETFGAAVASIVRDCSDALARPGEPKGEYWPRKQRHIDHLRQAPAASVLVAMADKLHNCQAIIEDARNSGNSPDFWAIFNGSRDEIARYYEGMLAVANERLPGNTITLRLNRLVPELVALARA